MKPAPSLAKAIGSDGETASKLYDTLRISAGFDPRMRSASVRDVDTELSRYAMETAKARSAQALVRLGRCCHETIWFEIKARPAPRTSLD